MVEGSTPVHLHPAPKVHCSRAGFVFQVNFFLCQGSGEQFIRLRDWGRGGIEDGGDKAINVCVSPRSTQVRCPLSLFFFCLFLSGAKDEPLHNSLLFFLFFFEKGFCSGEGGGGVLK